jgi:L-2-amino-thiazoline-4-carboxylic acid hydrolase
VKTIVKKISLARVMADTMGLERAAQLRRAFSNQIAIPVFEKMFAPAERFIQCGARDFLPPFKQYYVALMDAIAESGREEAEVVQDTTDVFQLNVTYCAWAEIVTALGNPAYCAYSPCYGDEVFLPHLCAHAGFAFRREGTLAQGAPVCDFAFTRVSARR